MFHNNVHLFVLEPFNPDARLAGRLDLLRILRPDVVPKHDPTGEGQAIAQVIREDIHQDTVWPRSSMSATFRQVSSLPRCWNIMSGSVPSLPFTRIATHRANGAERDHRG